MRILFILALALLIPGIDALGQCTFTNPIKSAESPDPYVIFKNGYYYYMVTTGDGVWIHRSPKLQDVGTASRVKVWSVGGEIKSDVWAPELHYINGKWYIYACGSIDPASLNMKMFVLEGNSQDPLGSYTYKGILSTAGAIDESIWQNSADGKIYITWSQFDPEGQCIYIAPMNDPLSIGNPRVKISAPVNAWEKNGWNVNEGPIFLKRNNKLHIIYSASGCSTPDYCLACLTCSDGNYLNAASWIKSNGPVFQRSDANGVWGPGHNGFTTSPNGAEFWIIYHAKNTTNNTNADRSTRIQQYSWNGDDTPNFGVPVKTSTAIHCPSSGVATPFIGGPYSIPGTVEAENFNYGGESVAYHDNELNNKSGAYRNEGVDVEACSEGGFNTDWSEAGEWMEYTVNVANTTTYKMEARVASPIGGTFHLELDGNNITGTLAVPNTGGWQNWIWVTKLVSLSAGQHTLRFYIDQAEFNTNKFVFTIPTGMKIHSAEKPTFSIFPNPAATDHLQILTTGYAADELLVLTITDIQGRELFKQHFSGNTRLEIDAKSLSGTGIYFICVKGDTTVLTQKIILLK